MGRREGSQPDWGLPPSTLNSSNELARLGLPRLRGYLAREVEGQRGSPQSVGAPHPSFLVFYSKNRERGEGPLTRIGVPPPCCS
ncbi:hypothetical protein CRG98_043823 [Punica granatum]|uniref:Uncharacterized protein n=1 Tax=Punica granatum TaxID=22663 RepID=A0A2I0HVS8_PUNGR|nr:hypothetical protein CRG98_043823 [Punica granatum]